MAIGSWEETSAANKLEELLNHDSYKIQMTYHFTLYNVYNYHAGKNQEFQLQQ